jgi:hypothetical protein
LSTYTVDKDRYKRTESIDLSNGSLKTIDKSMQGNFNDANQPNEESEQLFSKHYRPPKVKFKQFFKNKNKSIKKTYLKRKTKTIMCSLKRI